MTRETVAGSRVQSVDAKYGYAGVRWMNRWTTEGVAGDNPGWTVDKLWMSCGGRNLVEKVDGNPLWGLPFRH